MLLIVSPGEMLLSKPQSNFTLIGRCILMLNTLWFQRQSPAALSYFLFPAITNTTTHQHTDGHRSMAHLAILLHLKLCLQLGGNIGWSDWPEWTSCYTAGEHRCGSCPSHWIASALTASAPTVRFSSGGVDKRSWSAGRMGSVCAVCISLISPQRASVQIIPHSPTKITRAQFNRVCSEGQLNSKGSIDHTVRSSRCHLTVKVIRLASDQV